MKKLISILAIVLAIAICSIAYADFDYGSHTEYPLKDTWMLEPFPGMSLISFMSGSIMFNAEDFMNSTMGEITLQREFDSIVKYQDEMDPELVAYWADQGVIKELHNGEDQQHKWTTYTPKYMLSEENADKKWPAVFVLHGNGNTIFQAESWGYAQICEENGFIAVMPEMNNMDDWETDIPLIVEELKAKYPVDETRIYLSGFSKGGRTTLQAALRFPEIFAACSPGGVVITHYSDDVNFADVKNGMPICHIGGSVDQSTIFPYDTKDKQMALNRWLNVNDLTSIEVTGERPNDQSNKAVLAVGVAGDAAYTEERDGTNYYFVDYKDAEGICKVRLVSVYGMPHWPSPSQGQIAWEFMSQFARNEDGSLSVAK